MKAAKGLEIPTIYSQLVTIGVVKITTKELNNFMLNSPNIDEHGKFFWSFKGTIVKSELAYKKIAPGVYTLSIKDFQACLDSNVHDLLQGKRT